MTALQPLCRRHGIATAYDDPARPGTRRPVPEPTLRLLLDRRGADAPPAPERLAAPEGQRCHLPDWLRARPAWGLFCQLYELRSDRNWGIGDFRDLADLARIAGAAGADFLGVNPLHALFPADPARRSPFFPSSRRFLNPLYIAVDALPGAEVPPEAAALRAGDRVDLAAVTRVKFAALRRIHATARFGDGPLSAGHHAAFRARGGIALARHALFDALSLHQVERGHGVGWTGWAPPLRDIRSMSVAEFAAANEDEIDFHIWLQWVASVQLDAARDAARDAGMRLGLYLDLAVGEAPDGSAAWSAEGSMMDGLRIGAPPDVFAADGQDWGLAAPSPGGLAKDGCAAFRAMIEAQLRHAGALRIDHAMALWQLFLIPEGESPAAGAHLRYPFPQLVAALAEVSQAHGALIIGEDLGFVPKGFRAAMEAARILSYRILYFEQDARGFVPPDRWPRMALACLSTHDLPTLAGWWRAEDIALRRAHGLVGDTASEAQARTRADERGRLVHALAAAGLLDAAAEPPDAAAGVTAQAGLSETLLVAAHRFIARSPCLLAGVRLADLVGPEAPTNLPGTIDSYPNWSLRSPTRIEAIAAHPVFRAVTAAMATERPRR